MVPPLSPLSGHSLRLGKSMSMSGSHPDSRKIPKSGRHPGTSSKVTKWEKLEVLISLTGLQGQETQGSGDSCEGHGERWR